MRPPDIVKGLANTGKKLAMSNENVYIGVKGYGDAKVNKSS